jgi:hypothetical protein
MTEDADHHPALPQTPVGMQVLSLLLFTGFAITATSLAFVFFWPAGFALAALVIWRGFGPLGPQGIVRARRVARAAPAMPDRPSGQSASFAAYRHDMLDRLEQEQEAFDGFLTRLRAAKDKTEFDDFLDDRARRNALPTGGGDALAGAA